MAVTTLDAQVESLLSRQVAAAKISGVPATDVEASAVFDSIALNLLLRPRSALYFALMARNGLLAEVQREVDLINALLGDIADLANPSYKIQGAPTLRRARAALLALEGLPRVQQDTTALRLFNNAVTEFLNKNLSKNVRRRGSTELVRPAAEAGLDLVDTLAALKELHTSVVERLYLLIVGVDNFISAPFNALLGTSTVARARVDLENIIEQIERDGSPSPARDFAIRLFAGQAAIDALASPPSPFDPIFPDGSTALSVPQAVTVTSLPGPFLFTGSPTLSVSVNGALHAFSFFAGNAAVLVGDAVSFPLTIPDGRSLFVNGKSGGTTTSWKVDLAGTYANLAALLARMAIPGLNIVQFAGHTNRWMYYSTSYDEISIAPTYTWTRDETYTYVDGGTTRTVTAPTRLVSTLSAHSYVGVPLGKTGTRDVPTADVADAIASLFPELRVLVTSDGTLVLSTVETSAGTTLVINGPSSLGLTGTYQAPTTSILLPGIDIPGTLQIGDRVALWNGSDEYLGEHQVASIGSDSFDIDVSVPSFSGKASGKSSLLVTYSVLISKLKFFLRSWANTSFTENLDVLDRALAPLGASASPAQRNAATAEVNKLGSQLSSLLSLLADSSTMLPDGAAQEERLVVEGILTTLMERHYDRAADLLAKCDIQALMEMDPNSASYAGNFMKSASAVAMSSFSQTQDPRSETASFTSSAGHL